MSKKLHEKRLCFKFKQRMQIPYPEFELKGRTAVIKTWRFKVGDAEDFFDILLYMSQFFPSRPLLDLWRMYFYGGTEGICLESVIDPYWDMWASIESDCREYGWTPNQALDIYIDHLEYLRTVRGAENYYQRIKYEEDEAKLKQNK